MQITYGKSGWVRVTREDFPWPIHLRYDADGRVHEIYISGDGQQEVTSALLRWVPLGQITMLVMADGDALRCSLEDEAPEVWECVDELFPQPSTEAMKATGWWEDAPPTLTPPGENGIDDAFLREVGAAYLATLGRGERPNKVLAEQSGRPLRTVQHWVYFARKRGFLPPTRKSSAQ